MRRFPRSWDCNTEDFSAYWALRDAPDRKGISEIRHLEGLHRVEDHVRQRHPGVIFESCAGGGHRIDLAGAIRAVLACSRGHRNPEPLREAHRAVGEVARSL